MPSVNMTESPRKERNMTTYREVCDAFIEANYTRLYDYAMHKVRKDEERAQDLVQDICLRLVEGKTDIDFDKDPFAYIQSMMDTRLNRHARKAAVTEKFVTKEMEKPSAEEEFKRANRLDESFLGLRHDIPQLLSVLTPQERQYILWQMEGFTMPEMVKMLEKPVSTQRIQQVVKKAMEKMTEKATVLIQDAG